jgi:hypothetical protein
MSFDKGFFFINKPFFFPKKLVISMTEEARGEVSNVFFLVDHDCL